MSTFRGEISSLIRSEKLFILFAMIACFCITAEYSITRPASQSIFLGIFSAKSFPAIWLATVPLNFLIVTLYNRFLPRFGPLGMMGAIVSSIALINVICALFLPIFPQLIFFHFCWKDIYILLMFKQLWSMIHSTIPGSRAKYLYGIIFGVGTCGSVLGSLIPSYFAVQFGSAQLFLFTLPIYALLFFAYSRAYRVSGATEFQTSIAPEKNRAREGFILIAKSRYLLGVLLLVVFMQVSVALVEYQFSHHLELAIPETDLRTAYTGKLIGLINVLSLGFQVAGSVILYHLLGLRNSHFMIPLLLCSTAIGLWFSPTFGMATLAFVFTKSIDFSLFGVLREMLFVPLKMDEKFRAKAIIDVFAYRTSKALASFLLLGLQFWVGSAIFALSNYLSIAIFCAWLAVVAILFHRKTPELQLS